MYAYLLAIALLFINTVHAEKACNITNLSEFYFKVKSNGPLLFESTKQKERNSSVVDIAKQKPNPELEFEYLKGHQRDLDIKNYALTARHIVEFGSKREKRVIRAKKFKELRNTEIDLRLFNSNLKATIEFRRIAQLNITIGSVKEVVDTFDKVIKKLASRKRLNPEEVVSLSTLRLASNDYRNQLNDLENEKVILLGNVSFLSNCKKIAPKYVELKYKNIKLDLGHSTVRGLSQLEDLKVDLALGELEVQKSLGYSNISIGPKVEYQGQGDTSFMSAGVSVSFAFPLFQTNDGGKMNALKNVSAQKISSKNRKELFDIQRGNLISKIRRSVETLSKMPNLAELEKKHSKVEKLFSRGVVSIPMTIESHRQQVDFLESKFKIENDILNTYGQLVLISGDMSAFEAFL